MVSKLIISIAALQATESNFFQSGLFPSIRENKYFHYERNDSNIFVSATIAFILRQLKAFEIDSNKLEIIIKRIINNYPFYQNRDGLETYNFWLTNPSRHFPNGYLMHHFKHFKLPDDIDDTSLIYLTKGYSTEQIVWLKTKLQLHTDANRVYSTWFGESMPTEHDACALCNLMYLIFESDLELNEFDLATLEFLNDAIISSDFLNRTFWISRHYDSVPLIIYHYARLIGNFEIPELAEAQNKLIEILPELFSGELVWLNRVLLQTAYIKIKGGFNDTSILEWNGMEEPWEQYLETQSFYSFIGAPFAPLKNSFMSNLASKKNLQLGWKCKAHELTLVLENVILRNNLGLKK